MSGNLKLSKFDFIALAQAPGLDEADKNEPVWNVICQTVVSKSHAAGNFEITLKMLHEAVDNFKNRSTQKIPIYFEHYGSLPPDQIDPEKGAPPRGHVLDMQVRPDGRLWGLCLFYEPAKTYVRQGQYCFFSPGLLTDSLDRSTGKRCGMRIMEVSLVGNPHLYDMPEVRAGDDQASIPDNDGSNRKTLTTTTVPVTGGAEMNLEEALAKITSLQLELSQERVKVAGLEADKTKLESAHKVALAEAQAKTGELQTKYDTLVGQVVDADVELAYKTYQKERGLTDAHKADLKAIRLALGAEGFARQFPLKAGGAPAGTGAGGTNPTTLRAPEAPAYLFQDLAARVAPRPAGRVTLGATPAAGGGSVVDAQAAFKQAKALVLRDNPNLSDEMAILKAHDIVVAQQKGNAQLWPRAPTKPATRTSSGSSTTRASTSTSAVS